MPEIPTSWMAGEPDTYSIGQLTTLDDSALNALAAELRGAKLAGLLGKEEIDVWEFPEKPAHDNYKLQIRVADWSPTTDRNQSGELLMWGAAKGAEFEIQFRATCKTFFLDTHINANDARAETIAFCAAMLAMEGRLR